MISLLTHDFFSGFPLLFLALSACFFLSFFSFFFSKAVIINSQKKHFVIKHYAFNITLLIIAFTFIIELNTPIQNYSSFWGFLNFDFYSHSLSLIVLFLSFLSFLSSRSYIITKFSFTFEYFFLILFGIFSLIGLPACSDFLGIYLFLELQSLIFYTLACFNRSSAFSTEAGVKYFIMGAFSSGILLFGMSLIYGMCGSLNFEILKTLLFYFSEATFSFNYFVTYFGFFLIVCSFLFKLSAAPFHFWSPEVYEGSVAPVSLFFAVVPKIALFGSLVRISVGVFFEFSAFWTVLFAIVAFLSLLFGSFSALAQKKVKKFLAFSSVTHVGFIIAALSAHSFDGLVGLFFYLLVYSFLSLCFWSFVVLMHKEKNSSFLVDFKILAKQNPFIGGSLCILLFSIAGIPPLSGFGAKFFSFIAVVEQNEFLLAVVIVLFAVVSCFYYLRVIKWIFFDNSSNAVTIQSNYNLTFTFSRLEAYLISFSLFISSILFMLPDFCMLVAHRMALSLF
uniref:NADH dehydrogenase subunit 2 n=2 Tax=Thraustochytriidae TaxID=33674 RepID=A0A481XH68_9STRA|nr:NADH dehydrogenase subunit 2 [Schizochytrium sp. TIO1101]QBK37922.1 NADH dehydrogenase subunit 2 [Aurantiochytrium acetophilum]